MPLLDVAVLAALQGFSEALPISRSGHTVVAGLWLDAGPEAAALTRALHLGTAAALVIVARRRLLGALGEGVRAVSRPTLFQGSAAARDAVLIVVGAVVSLITGGVIAPRVEMWTESPTATGLGLCVTGLSLASTLLVPRPAGPLRRRAARHLQARSEAPGPSLTGAVLVGLAVGLASFPGASRVGAALTVLLWMGVEPDRAVDLSFLVSAPTLVLAFAGSAGRRAVVPGGTLMLGLVLAFVCAALASEILRALAQRRRVSALALWTVPLGLATLAYAHALPLPA